MLKLHLDRAMKEVTRILSREPENVAAWKLKGEIALRQVDLDGALQAWTRASELDPDDYRLLHRIGDLLIRRNDRLEDALTVYGKILRHEPRNTRVMISMGSIHERRHQWDDAAAMYEAALAIDPNLVRARSSLGAVHFKRNEYGSASRELRKAIELSPRDLRSHVFYGLSQNHLGHYDFALAELKKAVAIDPHYANRLIGVREQKQQFLHLIEVFTKAFNESPREAGRSYDLAVIYYYEQNYVSAWKFLIRAEQLRYPIPLEFKEVLYSKRKLYLGG
ncbi:MAG: tetratricopeptide repeat protein [Acidobacteriota bacterium]